MYLRAITAAALLIVPVGPTVAYTGNATMEFCSGTSQRVKDTCAGMFNGALEVILWNNNEGMLVPQICFPDGVEASQSISIIRDYLDDHPERLHLPLGAIAHNALAEAFPC